MRTLWCVLPRCKLSFNTGKFLTRTLLRPEPSSLALPVRFGGRIPMILDLGSFVANDLYCLDDHYESITLRLWRELSKRARFILDIGSHIGTFALVAADANPSAKIIAVEVDDAHFRQLQKHAASYPNISPVHAAIADQPSMLWFCPGDANDGAGRLCPEKSGDPRCRPVEAISLSSLCQTLAVSSVDLIKIDVEGYEHALLTGDLPFWETLAPANIILELTIDRKNRAPADEIFRIMQGRGYSFRRLQGLYAMPFGKRCDLANWHFYRS